MKTPPSRKERDREQFLELLARHEAQLLGFLCAIMPSFHDAEDVYQQTLLTMWQKFDEFTPGTNFVAWGCRIGRNKAMNLLQLRRASHLDEDVINLLMAAQEEEEPLTRQAQRQALSGCLDKLKKEDQALVRAAYSPPHSIKQVALDLGRSPSGIYNSLSRIRATLFRCIQATIAQQGIV